MKLTIESTGELTRVGPLVCRVWIATTESGAQAAFLCAGIATQEGTDPTEFDSELIELGRLEQVGQGVFALEPEPEPTAPMCPTCEVEMGKFGKGYACAICFRKADS